MLLTAGVAECKVLSQYVVAGCHRTGLVTHLSTAAISNYVVGAAMLSAHYFDPLPEVMSQRF